MTATKISRAKGYYYGWNIVAVTALSQAASFGIAINCLSLYIANWARDLHAPVSLLALCYTVNGLGFGLLAPLAGAIADKRSVRVMMTVGLLGVSVLFGLASQARHVWQLISVFATIAPVAMIIAGSLPSTLLVSRWFEKRRGLAIGFSIMGQTLAGAVLPPILGIVIPSIGWRPTFLIIAGFLAFICAPTAFFALRDWPTTEKGREAEFSIDQSKDDVVTPPEVLSVREIMRVPNFWILMVAMALSGVMSASISVNIAPLTLSRGFTIIEAGTLISALSIGALAYKLVAGYAIDRLSCRLVLKMILAAGITGVMVLRVAHTYPLLLVGVLLIASCSATLVPIATLVARQFGAASFGRAMGMVMVMGPIGVFAPPLVAFMHETTKSYGVPLLLVALCGLVGLLAAMFFRAKPQAT